MAERGKVFYQMVRERVAEVFHQTRERKGDVALVAGCGVGACLVPLLRDFDHIIGVDPDLEVLILCKRAAEDLGATNVTLFQGIAQDLPLDDKCVDFIIAEDVIEHLIDIDSAFSELGRVLAVDGVFVGNSVNRYNLLRPEPHVKLWFMGLLPRALQKRYARWRRGVEGYDVWVRPPSYYELLSAVRRGIGPQSRVVFPKAAAFGFPAFFDRVLEVIEKIKPLEVMLLWIFPAHLVVGRRTAPLKATVKEPIRKRAAVGG
jgi:SAM-dependent methyltransferase